VSTTIFGLAMRLFPFFGLPVSSLGLTMAFSFAEQPAGIATVRLPTKAAPADTKYGIAPSTLPLK
jgi:hypothetical protein